MAKVNESFQIAPASAESLAAALDLVFGDQDFQQRAARVETWPIGTVGEGLAEGVLEARRHGRLIAAIAWQLQEGKAALTWPPRAIGGEPAAALEKLLEAMLQRLARDGVRVVHVLFEEVRQDDDRLLRSFGFQPLAELLYLVSEEIDFPRIQPVGPLEFELYGPGNHARLAAVVEATYEGTLDCPALDGVREVEDVLAGYRSSGVFRPDSWTIARHQGRDVGCLLVVDHPEFDNGELVYMGLVPSARGHGWGVQLAQHAQWTARCLGRRRLVVAVDAKNVPALRIYTAVGFRQFDQRTVYLKVVPPVTA